MAVRPADGGAATDGGGGRPGEGWTGAAGHRLGPARTETQFVSWTMYAPYMLEPEPPFGEMMKGGSLNIVSK